MKDGEIKGLIVKKVPVYDDNRGILYEIFRRDELHVDPAMAYASYTKPGVFRGPHEHVEQTDVFVFANGQFMFFAWDNRIGSETYMNRSVHIVGEANMCQIVVPYGVVHAYGNISNTMGLVLNAPDKLYAGFQRKSPVDEIRHEADHDNLFLKDMKLYYENYRASAQSD